MKKKHKFSLLLSIFILSCLIIVTKSTNISFYQLISSNSTNKYVDYTIDLEKFNISNNNTNATQTTKGINEALVYAKENNFKSVKLPDGHYAIDTSVTTPITLKDSNGEWTHNRQGISMQSDMELILDGTILEMIPTDDPYYSIFTISNCKNSKVTGGTILGDRDTHDYGMRINDNGTELENGSFDENTGLPKNDDTQVRTKDFIDDFNGNPLPDKFYLSVLENTTKNTVDAGVRYIYCYDKNENYLGLANKNGNGFISQAELLPNTSKIKVSFKDEQRLDAVYYITDRDIYFTHEFGAGITIADSQNIDIDNVTIKNTIGDCITTIAPPLEVTVDNLYITNSTFENARRQGISFVATGENYLVQNCNIGNINGVDPQSGIDFEHYNYVKDVIIDSCNFYDNRKWDIINYNGQDIEVKNSKFTGGIASTFGWNMNINNNNFEYKDIKNNPKIHNGVLALSTDKTNGDNAYFKVNNNTIKNYKGGSSSNLSLSEFTNNTVSNSTLQITSPITNNNTYTNSNIMYNLENVKDEVYNNSSCSIDSEEFNTVIDNFVFEDSQFNPRGKAIIKNSKINNKTKPFGDTSSWWSLDKFTTFENCDITTEYKKEIPFLSNYYSNTLFENCNLNLSRYLFSLNYGSIKFEGCDFIFNNLSENKDIVEFDKIVYGDETNYWYFKDCHFESSLPIRINTPNFKNNTYNNSIIVD